MTAVPYAYPTAAPISRRKPSALPDGPRRYAEMLRGPRRRWWRPLLALILVLPLLMAFALLATIPVAIIGAVQGVPDLAAYVTTATSGDMGPVGFSYLNVVLAALIPTAGLSIWIAHRIRPRYLSSVAGGIRWRWQIRCVLLTLPLWAVFLLVGFLADPLTPGRSQHWVALLILGLLLTPLQAAGEEYLFRGWIMQNVGSYFARPLLGLIVSLTVSTALFAAAHTSPDPWVLGSIGCLAVASGIAADRTGGLEAGIAMHVVNNVLIGIVTSLYGGADETIVTTETTGTPFQLLSAIVVHAAALALILWQAKRQGIDRYYRPTGPAALDSGDPIGVELAPAEPLPEASWNPIPALNQGPDFTTDR